MPEVNRTAMDLIVELEGKVRKYKVLYAKWQLVNGWLYYGLGFVCGSCVMALGLRMGWWRL